MNIYEDYKSYIEEHLDLINKIKNRHPNISVLIDDVLKVTEYVQKEYFAKSKISEELEEIFEVGYGYLTNVLSDLEVMFKEYFNDNDDKIEYYTPIIVYSVYLDDFKCHLESEEKLTERHKEYLESAIDNLDHIMNHLHHYDMKELDNLINELNIEFEEFSKFQPVYAVFALVCEELDLF